MKINLRRLLLLNIDSETFKPAITCALRALEAHDCDDMQELSPGSEKASRIGNLYAFRQTSGYFNDNDMVGVEESIEEMRRSELNVELCCVATDAFLLGVWRYVGTETICGLVLASKRSL
jgi:hypothetical protein